MIVTNKIVNDVFQENCYIVYNSENLQGVIIDPGSNYEDIYDSVKQNGLKIKAILLTHGHFDHIMSCKKFQMLGIKIYISKHDAPMCNNDELNFAKDNGCNVEPFYPDVLIDDEVAGLSLDGLDVKVLHVAGHSKGGLAYIIGNNLFSGDTLFEHGYGRTDLKGGNFREILSSIKILRSYTKSCYKLFAGHDY